MTHSLFSSRFTHPPRSQLRAGVLFLLIFSPRMEFFPFDIFVHTGPPPGAPELEPGGGGPEGFYLGFEEMHRTLQVPPRGLAAH